MKNFNIIIVGVGGQGLISLAQIIAQAAFADGYDVKTSELHGLSQRGGSVKAEVRFGKKIWSPLIAQGKTDLVFALESQEALSSVHYANPKTAFLVNDFQSPTFDKTASKEQVVRNLKQISKTVHLVPAEQICQKELGNAGPAGVYLLALAARKNLIPVSEENIIKGIKAFLPQKYWDINLRAVKLAGKVAD